MEHTIYLPPNKLHADNYFIQKLNFINNALEDGWTIVTKDRKPSAHFEHDVAIAKGKAEVLSTFKYIEEVLNKN